MASPAQSGAEAPRFAQVVFNLPLDRAFDYAVPASMRGRVHPGARVVVPFGHRRLIGYVHELRAASAVPHAKPIARIIDEQPVLRDDARRLASWVADTYVCALGEAYAAMMPTALRVRSAGPQAATRPNPSARAVALTLTAQQAVAFATLCAQLEARQHAVTLLHGVTGSGKTELYLQLIARALERGDGAICLVPEIALTPQAIDRFRQRFGEEVSLWHSRLTIRQRADCWQRVADGRSRVVVGTRSAVFAPVARLGVVILDEEHDPSYKQDQTPRYHARDVAIERARLSQAVVVLGSATPSIESYDRARRRAAALLELTERVEGRPMPAVEIIDMRQEFLHGRKLQPLSLRLQLALQRISDHGQQAILLLNRRGFARVVQCPGCGAVMQCTRCDVPLVYHARPPKLQCHYCSVRKEPPELCPSCEKGYLRYRGSGTERIESELHRLFPGSPIARMDADTTKKRDSHREFYDALRNHQIGMLVGTQMVAKGFDLPQVTLVGVVSADTSLNLPDFRAGEWTFDLLTQVAGRAGRGDAPGQVFIQTFCPGHYAIQAAASHDYRRFFEAEIEMRRRLKLPPCVRLVELTVQGKDAEQVRETAKELALTLNPEVHKRHITMLGPAPHRIEMLRRMVRWRLILKAPTLEPITTLLRQRLGEGRKFRGLPVIVDVDPM